jgi:hypothetical protein
MLGPRGYEGAPLGAEKPGSDASRGPKGCRSAGRHLSR